MAAMEDAGEGVAFRSPVSRWYTATWRIDDWPE